MEKLNKQTKTQLDTHEENTYYKLTLKEEPIKIKNDYLLKSELTSRLLSLSFFIGLLYILVQIQIPRAISENDMLDLRMYQAGVLTVAIGIIWVFVGGRKLMLGLIKNNFYINIFNDKIDYEYITEDGVKNIYTIFQKDIKKVSWSWFPYSVVSDEIWITDIKNKDNKNWGYLFSPLHIFVYFIMQFIYLILCNFSFQKYILFRFCDGIVAIPKNNNISINNNKFEWKSIINRFIFKGGYYVK